MSVILYDAWEVRIPFPCDHSWKQWIKLIYTYASECSINVRFRRGRGTKQGRYHYWEARTQEDAMVLYLAFGDSVKQQQYPVQ